MPRQAARLHPPCWPAVTVALPAELPHHADPGLGGLYLRARVPLDGDVEPMPVASGVGAGDLVAIQNSGGVVAGVPAVRVVVSGRCHHRAAWPADTFGRSRMCHLCTAAGTVRSPWPRLSGKTDGMRSGRPRPAPAARLRWLPLPPTSSSWGPLLPALWVVYRDVEELLAERGVKVDHVTVYRWVLRFTRLLAEAARPAGMPLAIAGRSTRDLCEGRKTQ
jgi:hypothetical protein